MTVFGSFIDLATLDGVTIAIDYDDALANLDRGVQNLKPLSRSNSEEMQGVAMSPAVMRDGKVLTHLVFNAGPIAPLIVEDASQEDKSLAIGLIAHECAHVQITAQKERAIPQARFGTVIEDYERAVMFQLAEICWDEYAACRLSAPFAANQNAMHASVLMGLIGSARQNSDNQIKLYRTHADLNLLVSEAGAYLCNPIKSVSYLLGGMDAIGEDWSNYESLRAAIVDTDYDDIIDDLHSVLRNLWETQEKWDPELSTFAPLEAITKRLFESGGIYFETSSDGRCRIEVPITSWTVPY